MMLSNLNLLATAPGGVARLRELILTLAVQGKLVPQDPADEPASRLLQKIRAEKDRLIAEGKIKKDKPLAAITDEEKPFGLPQGWEWVRLSALLQKIGAGSTPLGGREVYVSSGVKFLRSQNVWDEGLMAWLSLSQKRTPGWLAQWLSQMTCYSISLVHPSGAALWFQAISMRQTLANTSRSFVPFCQKLMPICIKFLSHGMFNRPSWMCRLAYRAKV